MKNFLLLILLSSFVFIVEAKKKAKKLIKINGLITQTLSYCGGKQAPREVLDEMKTPKPFQGKTIFVKIGKVNDEKSPVIKKIICDENGAFSIQLTCDETYIFIEEWKSKPFLIPADTDYIKWDIKCFTKSYLTADFVLTVKSKNNPIVNINYHKPCFYNPYCGNYSGPLPP